MTDTQAGYRVGTVHPSASCIGDPESDDALWLRKLATDVQFVLAAHLTLGTHDGSIPPLGGDQIEVALDQAFQLLARYVRLGMRARLPHIGELERRAFWESGPGHAEGPQPWITFYADPALLEQPAETHA